MLFDKIISVITYYYKNVKNYICEHLAYYDSDDSFSFVTSSSSEEEEEEEVEI